MSFDHIDHCCMANVLQTIADEVKGNRGAHTIVGQGYMWGMPARVYANGDRELDFSDGSTARTDQSVYGEKGWNVPGRGWVSNEEFTQFLRASGSITTSRALVSAAQSRALQAPANTTREVAPLTTPAHTAITQASESISAPNGAGGISFGEALAKHGILKEKFALVLARFLKALLRMVDEPDFVSRYGKVGQPQSLQQQANRAAIRAYSRSLVIDLGFISATGSWYPTRGQTTITEVPTTQPQLPSPGQATANPAISPPPVYAQLPPPDQPHQGTYQGPYGLTVDAATGAQQPTAEVPEIQSPPYLQLPAAGQTTASPVNQATQGPWGPTVEAGPALAPPPSSSGVGLE